MSLSELRQGQIAAGLRELGVGDGDAVLVHSSLSRFGYVHGGADAVIDALLQAVGPLGTVMVPTHTWGTVNAENPVFDVRRTPSMVGRITEVFRQRRGALRSLHPTHSCAGIGPAAAELLRGHETQVTPCGSTSPYQRLMECGGKIVFLGVTFFVNTSFHALEEMAGAPYLFDRFQMLYVVDYRGDKRPVPSRRHTDGLSRSFENMEPVLTGEAALVKGTIGRADVRVVDAAKMRDIVLPMLAEDPFVLLSWEAAGRVRRGYEQWHSSWRA